MRGDMIMKHVGIGIILVTSLLISAQLQVMAPAPRHCKGLEVYFYETSNDAYDALKAGEVDIIQWELTKEQYQEVVTDSTLLLAGYSGFEIYEYDLNNNYTIPSYSGVRSPTNEITFRQALAHMADKNWIVSDVLKGFGERIDVPIGAAIMGYANESVIGGNYPYAYNLTRATELLDIYFADTDLDGTRNYPVGWSGRESGPNLDPIIILMSKYELGQALVINMQALGIPVQQITNPFEFPFILEDRNYHIYTGGWYLGRYPTHLWNLFHSDNWYSTGSNLVTGMNASNEPNYPDLDEALEDVYYAKDIATFKDAVKKATGLLVDYCVNIPLYSPKNWWAYSKSLAGIVNMNGYGLENTYTFLNAYKVDDPDTPEDESQEPIRMGTKDAPSKLNILYSSWRYDYAVLDRVFDSLLSINPYDLSVDQPWIAQDWEASTWYDPQDGENKTKVTYWIRKDVFWHAPVTGEEVRQFTAHDVEFTIWYTYAFDDCWQWSSYKHVHHTNIINDFTIEVYFDTQSFWLQYYPTGPLLPKDEYLSLLCGVGSTSFYSDGTNCTESTKYVFTDDQVLQVISADIDGTPLVEGVDFEIFATGSPDYTHNEIHFLKTLANGTVTIDYYTPTVDPDGYYLGNLDWTLTFYSIGPYYPVDIEPGVGGHAILNCNPGHFLGAPPLGEIDWAWAFTGTTKPRSGYYQVGLFDAVRLLKAYSSSGYYTPDSNWFPGADIDPTDLGHVGLYDAVTLLTNYGEKFGTPPDP
jgi:ABC-type transport system substrate-binding protein